MIRLPLLLTTIFFAAPGFADAASICYGFAPAKAAKVLSIFHDAKKTEEQKRGELAVLFHQAVDTDWIGRAVLGRAFRNAMPDQQRNYLATYGEYVTQSYVSQFDDDLADDIQNIRVVKVSPAGEHRYNAAMKIERKSGDPVNTTLMLDDSGSACRVHDVTVEGVSLMISQRSEFASLAASKGIDGVTASMKSHLMPAVQ